MADRMLIFIVDDDPFIIKLLEKKFASENCLIESYGNGEDCLDSLNKNPDLVILDYFFYKNHKEVMNGMQILCKIKELKPGMPVIILSGQEKGEVILDLAKNGINDYVMKDINLVDNLNNAINCLLKQRA